MKTKTFLPFCLYFFASFLFSQTIDVMSFNIRLASVDDGKITGTSEKDKVKDLISYYEADFVGLQEAQKPQIDYLLDNNSAYGFLGRPRTDEANAEFSCIFI